MRRFSFLLLILLVGCFFSPNKQTSSNLRIGSILIPSTLDPGKSGDFASATILNFLYEGLTRCDHLGMAESIEVSEDGMNYTFTLRSAVWSDGMPVVAQDFITAWKRALNPDCPSPSSFLFYPIKNGEQISQRKCPIDDLGVSASDDLTIVVELEHPTPHFLSIVSLPPFLPVPSHRSTAEIEQGIVSNGPYELTSYNLSSHLTFTKNNHYWNASTIGPQIIEYQIIPDEQTALHLFEQGQLDWIGGALSPLPPDILSKRSSQIRSEPTGASTFCCFNTQDPPLSNLNLRRALSAAINREEIAQKLLGAKQLPATRILPPVLCEGKNRTIIVSAESTDFSNLPTLTLDIRSSATSRAIAQILQNQWKQTLGIQIEIVQSDAKTHIEKLRSGNYQIALANWISFYDDPINLLERFQFANDAKNYSKWESIPYQILLNEVVKETDLARRMELYEQLEDILAAEAPIAPIYHWSYPMLVQPWVTNLEVSSCGTVFFERCSCTPPL